MILWSGIGLGLVVGFGLSKLYRQPYQPPILYQTWIVLFGFLPQFLAIYLWNTRIITPDWLAAFCLIISQLILLTFAWLNRQLVGMQILIVGLLLNLTIIAVNGGFMPINPQTAERLIGEEMASQLVIGKRFGFKDILLPAKETHLEFLADRLLPPSNFPYQVAFSLGDVFIATGAFGILAYQRKTAI